MEEEQRSSVVARSSVVQTVDVEGEDAKASFGLRFEEAGGAVWPGLAGIRSAGG
jgi:hypothetical protein